MKHWSQGGRELVPRPKQQNKSPILFPLPFHIPTFLAGVIRFFWDSLVKTVLSRFAWATEPLRLGIPRAPLYLLATWHLHNSRPPFRQCL